MIRKDDLTEGQAAFYRLLVKCAAEGEPVPGQLRISRLLGVRTSTAASWFNVLQRKGWITFENHKGGHRIVTIAETGQTTPDPRMFLQDDRPPPPRPAFADSPVQRMVRETFDEFAKRPAHLQVARQCGPVFGELQ